MMYEISKQLGPSTEDMTEKLQKIIENEKGNKKIEKLKTQLLNSFDITNGTTKLEDFGNNLLTIMGQSKYEIEQISDSLISRDEMMKQLKDMSYTDGVFIVGKFRSDLNSNSGHYAHIDLDGTLTNPYPHSGSTWPEKYKYDEYTIFRLENYDLPKWY